jgi:hypothetical protein
LSLCLLQHQFSQPRNLRTTDWMRTQSKKLHSDTTIRELI